MVVLQGEAQNWGKLNSQGPLVLLASHKSMFRGSKEKKLCAKALLLAVAESVYPSQYSLTSCS